MVVFNGCFVELKKKKQVIVRGMSNTYLKIPNEKNFRSENFDFLSLKNLSAGHFLWNPNSRRYHWNLLFCYFNCERNYEYDVLKSKNLWFLLNKNINLIKTRQTRKWKVPNPLVRDEPCASAHIRIANQIKSVMSWSSREKEECNFDTVYFVKRKCF